MQLKDFLESATLAVLTWTLVEIARTRRIDAQQRDLQLLPAVMLYIRGDDDDLRLYIRNIGFGAAIMVELLPSKFTVDGEEHEYRFGLKGANTTLNPSEEREIEIDFYKGGAYDRNSHRHLDQFMAYFNPENIAYVNEFGKQGGVKDIEMPAQREIVIQFRDITGQRYGTLILFNEGGISVDQAPKRIGSASWLFKWRKWLADAIRP